MNLCQKFGRLLRNGGAYLSVRPDASNLSTTTALLYSAPAPAGAPVRLPSGFNAPPPFALFIKERLTGKTGGVTNMKIEKENWKNLSDNEKENYVANAKKVRDEKRHDFEKLPEYQQRELIEQHEHKTAKLRRLRKKKSLHKLHADTNRPKHPLVSYMVFAKTRYEEHTNTIQTRDERINFAKETGEQWRRMTELEKQPYVDQARSNLAAYHQQIEEWEQKYANEIQEWRKANEPKKKTVAKGSKRTKKAAAPKVELKKKLKEAEEKSSLGGDKKKGRSSTSSSSTTTANKKGDGGGETTDSKKKKTTTPAPKKVKKADVKEAVD